MPALTVVVPCFNHGRFLAEAVDSALAQTFDDLEVIVVDDGSTAPDTLRVLDGFARPRTRVLREPHRGKAAAVNRGIGAGGGRYLLVLDADDRIAPTYVAKGLAVLEARPETGIVYAEAEYIGKRSGPWLLPPFELRLMLRRNLIHSCAFFRRVDFDRAGGFAEDVAVEDWDFWLALLGFGRAVHRIGEPLFFYRKHRVRGRSKSKRMRRLEEIESQDRMTRRHAALYAAHVDVLFDEIRELRLRLAGVREARLHHRIARGIGRLLGRAGA